MPGPDLDDDLEDAPTVRYSAEEVSSWLAEDAELVDESNSYENAEPAPLVPEVSRQFPPAESLAPTRLVEEADGPAMRSPLGTTWMLSTAVALTAALATVAYLTL